LENLSKLIEQKQDKKYYLTELGIHAYNTMQENRETITSPISSSREFNSPLMKALMYLTPKKFISFKSQDRIYNSTISLMVLIIGAILCGLNGFYTLTIFYIETTEDIYSLPILFHVFLSILYIINFILYFLIVELICRTFYKKKENSLNFFLSFPIIFYPMIIYLIVHFILLSTGLIQIGFFSLIDIILLIFFQIWSLWLLTYNLSVSKGLKIERGLIIALLLHYGSFTIVLFILI